MAIRSWHDTSTENRNDTSTENRRYITTENKRFTTKRNKYDNLKKNINITRITRIVVFMILAAVISVSSFTGCAKEDELSFSEYIDQLFIEEVASNTLTLHYTLKNPADYGITDYEVILGDYSASTRQERSSEIESVLKDLQQYEISEMDTDDALTYSVLNDYLETQLALCEYELYEEPFLGSGGAAVEIPLLLAEYTFYGAEDVEDYLELLAQLDDYLADILEFEQEKADAGLFMSDAQCRDVIDALSEFISSGEGHYLITTFESKQEEVGISEEEARLYQEQNKQIVLEELIPAYENLIAELTALMGSGRNDLGLYYTENGRNYYELLVYECTGCSDSVADIYGRIEKARANDLAVCANLIAADAQLYLRAFSYEWECEDEYEMLERLQEQMLSDFPAAPDVNVTVSAVDVALEDLLAPAFYITVPLDDYLNHTIYVNGAYSDAASPDIYYFTTLAHEGFPGHLYQTVMSYEYGLSPIRELLNFPGYTEGWATYVEMMAFSYAGLDENLASLLMHNQAATLSLYASSDIGMHYYGWTMQDMYEFWGEYGVDDVSTVNAIAKLILAEPGNYLKYYVGYLCFAEMREEMQSIYGEDFSLIEFHEAVLKMGAAPFNLLEQYFGYYYD